MTTFTRQITFSGFQFNPALNLTAYGIRQALAAEVPDLVIYDLYLTDGSVENPFVENEDLLQIVQHRIDEGERRNVTHELHPGDWLIEDVFAEEGWRVISNSDLADLVGH